MIKRFRKGEFYSLLLVKPDSNGEPYTWTVNVHYTQRNGSFIHFEGVENSVYVVDLDNGDVNHVEYGKVNRIHCANIVKGWQW